MDGKNSQTIGGALVNLVQQALVKEGKEEASPKKSATKSAKVRWATTIITWLLLNVIWTFAVDSPSTNEVMSHDTKLVKEHQQDVPDILGLGHDVPLIMECDFRPKNESVANTEVEVWIEDGKGEQTLLWRGDADENCADVELELTPDKYNFIVTYSTGNQSVPNEKPITGEMTIQMYVWKPLKMQGYVVLNILGLILFITDGVIRKWMKQKRESKVRTLPLHKQRQKEDWENVVQSMSGGDAVDVEDLMIHQQSADESMELQRKRMREQFSAQEQVASASEVDDDDIIDDVLADDIGELGEGTTVGLEGKVQRDENIRTVGDIWKQLSESDEKKR
ncbi:MAG: hypothetical protein VX320_03985 [Candidatus Thermoplasmatota archaeon]|nr:hypothetical protein [Candidatus Thermoplasmatota archaeon]